MQYEILKASSPEELQVLVNLRFAAGWEVAGGPLCNEFGMWFQAMIKRN